MSDPYGLPEDLRRLISSARNNSNTTTTNLQADQPLCLYNNNNNNNNSDASSSCFPLPLVNTTCYVDPSVNVMVGDVNFFPRSTSHSTFPPPQCYDYSSSVVAATTTATNHAAAAAAFCGVSIDAAVAEKSWLGFDSAGNNRWPRQETLSLLEIRSRLDSKFRENNQKAPLWNEISRIMAEEFGYQRSGKKCKEKFENLYKYYKKTKEGKASRQDGKHYRFFRQLEAICGDHQSSTHVNVSASTNNSDQNKTTPRATVGTQTPSFTINHDSNNIIADHRHHLNNNLKSSDSLSFSNYSSEFETSSSENNDEDLSAIPHPHMMKHSRDDKQKGSQRVSRKSSWRAKVEEIVDSHMKKIIETQDAWMGKMLSVVEQREQEMATKEEERKRKESVRFDQQVHELWAKEKAWVEARDAALIEVVRKHIGIELEALPSSNKRWTEMEISNLIQLRTSFEQRVLLVRENGYSNNNNNNLDDEENSNVWEEIAEKMVYLGFDRNANECKKIWDEISMSLKRSSTGTSTTVVECGTKTKPWCLGLKLTDDG